MTADPFNLNGQAVAAELADLRERVARVVELAKLQAIACQAAHRADHARNWLDVLALLDGSARPNLPPEPVECCASGRCEVCSPGFDWGRDG